MECAIEGCPKPAGVPGTAKGLCSTHYNRLRRTGDPLTTITETKPKPPPTCSVDGCEKPRWARGWCGTHYRRWQVNGDIGSAELQAAPREGICRVDDCSKPVGYGIHRLCKGHYLRQMRHGDPLAGATSPGLTPACSIETCGRKHYARRLCRAHWAAVISRPRRRALEGAASGSCSPEQLAARISYYGGRCWVCGGDGSEVDHVKPLAAGGPEWPANLRPICKACNCRKGATWRDAYTATSKEN